MPKKKPKKLTPQQVEQLEVQGIQQMLEAPNTNGTNKFLLNINGGDSPFTTNKNSEIKYSLQNPIKLEIGDKVTLYEAFLNEQGLDPSTITLQEDLEVEMSFIYYVQGDTRNCLSSTMAGLDMEFGTYPPPSMVNLWAGDQPIEPISAQDEAGDLGIYGFTATSLLAGRVLPSLCTQDFGDANMFENPQKESVPKKMDKMAPWGGPNGQNYFLMDVFRNPNRNFQGTCINRISGTPGAPSGVVTGLRDEVRPRYGTKIIKVKAGNYSVSSLAENIQNQMSGDKVGDEPNSNLLLNKLYYPDRHGDVAGFPPSRATPAFENITKFDGSDTKSNNQVTQIVTYTQYEDFSPLRLTWGRVNPPNTDFLTGTGNNHNFSDTHRQYVWEAAGGSTPPSIGGSEYSKLFGPQTKNGKDVPVASFFACLPMLDSYVGEDGYWLEGKDPSFQSIMNMAWNPSKKYGTNDAQRASCDSSNGDEMTCAHYLYSNLNEILFPIASVSGESDRTIPNYPLPDAGNINNNPSLPSRFVGTASFQMSFNDKGRFAYSNLHEPYRLPSVKADGTSAASTSGQQATMYNNFTSIPPSNAIGQDIMTAISYTQFSTDYVHKTAYYPVDSAGGLCVSNFNRNLVKGTRKWKENQDNLAKYDWFTPQYKYYEWIQNMLPYDEWFDSTADAKAAWETPGNLWHRLGFSYNQMGNISGQLESRAVGKPPDQTGTGAAGNINRNQLNEEFVIKMPGVITHNDFDLSEIISTDGLGDNPYNTSTIALQKYGLKGPWAADLKALPDSIGGRNFENPYGAMASDRVFVLCDSKEYTAESLPDLNAGKSYFIIESDIIKPNYFDTKANERTILGIMSKKQASNDTIYSVQGIEYTITEERNVSEINISVRNPDGTQVPDTILGKNSGFVLMIDKAIKPAQMPINNF